MMVPIQSVSLPLEYEHRCDRCLPCSLRWYSEIIYWYEFDLAIFHKYAGDMSGVVHA